jgi:hypothetical protein
LFQSKIQVIRALQNLEYGEKDQSAGHNNYILGAKNAKGMPNHAFTRSSSNHLIIQVF